MRVLIVMLMIPAVLSAGPRKKAMREEIERLTMELAECQATGYTPTPCPEVIRAIAEDGDIDRNERKVVKAIMRDHKPVRMAKQARKRVVRVYRNERKEAVRTNPWRNLMQAVRGLGMWGMIAVIGSAAYAGIRGGTDIFGIFKRIANG